MDERDDAITTEVTFRGEHAEALRQASHELRRPPKRERVEIVITPARDAESIAQTVCIPQWHPDLADARILYLFTTQERKSKGKIVWASIKKLAPEAKYLSSGSDQDVLEGYDFLLLIDATVWPRLTGSQKVALIDHELCHAFGADTDDGWKWGTVGHDVEEFKAVIERHGFWNETVRDFADGVAKQLSLV